MIKSNHVLMSLQRSQKKGEVNFCTNPKKTVNKLKQSIWSLFFFSFKRD